MWRVTFWALAIFVAGMTAWALYLPAPGARLSGAAIELAPQ